MTLDDFRLLVARISLAAPLAGAKTAAAKRKRLASPSKPVRTATARPA